MSRQDKRHTLEADIVSGAAAEATKRHEADLFDRVGAERLEKLHDSASYPDHVASDRYRKAFFDYCMARLPKPKRALDLGTGQGTWAVRLARHAEEVTAIDLGEQILEVARNYAETVALNNITFLRGDAEDTGLDDDSYDIVGYFSLLMLLPDPEVGLNEAHRLLTPGGHLLLETLNAESLMYKFYYRPRHQRGQSAHARLRFMTYDELAEMLERCGYEVEHVSVSWSVIDWLVSRACGLARRGHGLGVLLPAFRVYYAATFRIGRWLGRHKRLRPFFREFHILARKPMG
jgi:ubiquinone/menaquinone biosynthesis C-methylase UbiE